MVDAEIRRKLGDEDRLTSLAFGLLSYLPIAVGLVPLLKAAKRIRAQQADITVRPDTEWFDTLGVTSVSTEFWPRFDRYGEPDILLEVHDKSRLRHLVVIEVKLDSPKSGRAHPDDELPKEDAVDPDQIVKYWRGLLARAGAYAQQPLSTLIYLTSHRTPPRREMGDSLRRADNMRLGWLSWNDVWRIAKSAAAVHRPANDLRRLLEKLGFRSFEGFALEPPLDRPRSGFWVKPRWFDHPPPRSLGLSFWRDR
jgi:hypothetical protein